jgi:hypothetical protein
MDHRSHQIASNCHPVLTGAKVLTQPPDAMAAFGGLGVLRLNSAAAD